MDAKGDYTVPSPFDQQIPHVVTTLFKMFVCFQITHHAGNYCTYNPPDNKLVKKSSLPLEKDKIFQKLHNIVQNKVHQEERTHLPLILIPNL